MHNVLYIVVCFAISIFSPLVSPSEVCLVRRVRDEVPTYESQMRRRVVSILTSFFILSSSCQRSKRTKMGRETVRKHGSSSTCRAHPYSGTHYYTDRHRHRPRPDRQHTLGLGPPPRDSVNGERVRRMRRNRKDVSNLYGDVDIEVHRGEPARAWAEWADPWRPVADPWHLVAAHHELINKRSDDGFFISFLLLEGL